ncbi:MAG: gliding motility-associated protein GldE [Bacteroidales bacterium]|nr:gliding motility-associated protein GldE [Bacteroidales bacterium]
MQKNLLSLQEPDAAESLFNASFIFLDAFVQPFSITILISLLCMLVLLFFSAMISGSETAFFSLTPQHLSDLRESQTSSGKLMLWLLERPKRLLATILIANNFVNVAIVILSSYIAALWFNLASFPILAFLVQVIVITALILLFGEILPKMYASVYPLRFAKNMAGVLKGLIRVFYPFSSLLVRSTSFLDKRIARKSHILSRSELSDAIEITAGESTPEEGKKILQGIVKFGDIEVKEIMRSRVDVIALDIQASYTEVMDVIVKSGFSRIPVYTDNFDNIKGILYVKDLLPHLDKDTKFNWEKLIRDAFFVPENKKINDLLQEFQERKIHLAIVVDEYGGTSGIITLEDVLEEIVGEITDESDSGTEEFVYEKIDEHTYIFEGKTTINDFCKIIGIDDDIFDEGKGESDSLAGLILELEGKIPEQGDETSFMNYVFKIIEVDLKRIKRIRVTITEEPDE